MKNIKTIKKIEKYKLLNELIVGDETKLPWIPHSIIGLKNKLNEVIDELNKRK